MILTAVKMNKYNKYHFSEQCWSETVVLAGVLPGTWSVGRPRCVCSVHPEPSERTAGPASCGVLPTESDTDASTSPRPDCTPEERREVRREIHRSVRGRRSRLHRGCSYQSVEGGHGEDSQASQHALGGPAGHGEETLGVRELAALQAGQVAPQPEQVQVEFLQVLLPLLDLNTTHRNTRDINCVSSSSEMSL